MTALDKVRALVDSISPKCICDDCITTRLNFSIRQHVNHKTRELAFEASYERTKQNCAFCGASKMSIRAVEANVQLDEVAMNSHSPPGWETLSLEITPNGKAPKHYGAGVFRFSAALTLSVILPRRGWSLVKKTKNYAYLTPPENTPNPPFHITIAIPPIEESLAIARRSYERGESWMGQLGEWPAWYHHNRNMNMVEMHRDQTTGGMIEKLHESPPQSSLHIGEWSVWEHQIEGVDGQFEILRTSNEVLPNEEGREDSHIPAEPLYLEGAPKPVKLNRYERNQAARRKCIEHFGATCQACGLNYEQKYGKIGRGLIHVHHITPVSEIAKEYAVDPLVDLVPLCATCHHVAHNRKPAFTIDELRVAISGELGSNTVSGDF